VLPLSLTCKFTFFVARSCRVGMHFWSVPRDLRPPDVLGWREPLSRADARGCGSPPLASFFGPAVWLAASWRSPSGTVVASGRARLRGPALGCCLALAVGSLPLASVTLFFFRRPGVEAPPRPPAAWTFALACLQCALVSRALPILRRWSAELVYCPPYFVPPSLAALRASILDWEWVSCGSPRAAQARGSDAAP